LSHVIVRTSITSIFWGTGVLAVACVDLAIQEVYHRVSSSSVGLVVVFASAVLAALAGALVRRIAGDRQADLLQRTIDLCALLIAGYWVVWPGLADTWGSAGLFGKLAVLTSLSAASIVFLTASFATWVRLRQAILGACLLFVGSEPVLGVLHARELAWPPGFQAQDAAGDEGRVATIVLLLDELNSINAEPFVRVLREHQLQVEMKAVASIGDGTARVLPAMFTGQSYDSARPCGPATICSGERALDFSRIRASRPDVDIVGFYHPYCAMQGLRYCARPGIDLAIFDAQRWVCGLWRRTGWPLNVNAETCRASAVGAWGAMSDRLLLGLRRAPTLTRGGVLFAHLALPHPPGHADDGTLPQHYEANLQRAAAAVRETLSTAVAHNLTLRVVVFSDHPLRQDSWCRGYPGFFSDACVPVARLVDDKVPLIVAGKGAPDLSAHSSNLHVFSLMGGWTR
jgi:hypothetical protein